MENLFPHEKFLHGKILQRNQIPQILHQKKIPQKTFVYLACSPSLGNGDQFILKDIVSRYFDYAEQNGYLKILIRSLWGKMSVGVTNFLIT